MSSFAEIVDEASSAPAADLLLAQVSIGYIAAGMVKRDAFLSWPRPARGQDEGRRTGAGELVLGRCGTLRA